MRSGGLFAGYGGLDMAVSEVFGAVPAWFSEIDEAPSKILAHHWPDVPNHGDITRIDWGTVEPVDILTGGFPCQDVSAAGKRAGLKPGTRSGLWNHMAYAINKLRPRYVVAENVRGLLSAEAHSDVEPCPWCLGDGPGEPPLRALGAVLADLAELGYDAQWCGLRAADVGAPHGRFRVFILARDTQSSGWDAARPAHWSGQPARPAGGPSLAVTDAAERAELRGIAQLTQRHLPHSDGQGARRHGSPADPTGNGRHEGWPEPAGELGGSDAAERGAVACRGHADGRGHVAADTDPDERQREQDEQQGRDAPAGGGLSPDAWGRYATAIRRWELTLGRHAPAPTELNSKGAQRLSPQFVEWMMGLPDGHVTAVPGVNRNAQLKALGNGVVPQQAIAALRHLASSVEAAA